MRLGSKKVGLVQPTSIKWGEVQRAIRQRLATRSTAQQTRPTGTQPNPRKKFRRGTPVICTSRDSGAVVTGTVYQNLGETIRVDVERVIHSPRYGHAPVGTVPFRIDEVRRDID